MDFKSEFLNCCYQGDLEGLQKIFYSRSPYNLNYGLELACKQGKINIINYLCNSPDLPLYGYKNIDIHEDGDKMLLDAIMQNNMPVVRYVFEHMEKYAYPKYDWVIAQTFSIAEQYPHLLQFLIEKKFSKEVLMTFIHEDDIETMNTLYEKYRLHHNLQEMPVGASAEKVKL